MAYNNIYPGINAAPNYGVAIQPSPQPYYGVTSQNAYQQSTMPLVYVHGREGANAYQLPPGVTKQLLWDDEVNRFYIKAIDEYGRPKIVADNDFFPHVDEPVKQSPSDQIDFSVYPTKKDLEEFLSKFDVSNYLTKNNLEEALSHFMIGERGRIVRNELDA